MKRSEIKVGDELYYARGSDWRCPRYASEPDGERAVVVEIPSGSHRIVVDLHSRYGLTSRVKVSAVLLRGHWHPTFAEVHAALFERKEAEDVEKRRRELARDRAYTVATRAARLGFVAHQSNEEIRISAEEFERILDRLDGGT